MSTPQGGVKKRLTKRLMLCSLKVGVLVALAWSAMIVFGRYASRTPSWTHDTKQPGTRVIRSDVPPEVAQGLEQLPYADRETYQHVKRRHAEVETWKPYPDGHNHHCPRCHADEGWLIALVERLLAEKADI